MNLKKLTGLAKKELDKHGGVKGITDQAKAEYERRGGADGLKASAKNVATAAKSGGTSPVDKAKAAADALKKEAERKSAAGAQ